MNPFTGVELYVKHESMNPGGSIKDRIALSMIEQAEGQGLLTRDKIVLEASSGNTAIGLAMVCAVKGYKLMVTMSESASEERKKILRAYGADIVLTPGHLGTDGAIEEAYRLAREMPTRYVLMDQFNNPANWQAHYNETGPEILEALGGKLDVVVVTMGTTGTLMGMTRRFRESAPHVRVIGVEPFIGHKIQGLKNMKESYAPGIFNPGEPDAIVNVEDEQAFECARNLARHEGLLVGMSAGAAVAVALAEAEKLQRGCIVALLPDGGERYLSTPLFESAVMPAAVQFFNTLSRKLEPLQPQVRGKVGIYSCGPSLDGPSDIGLCRRVVFADLLRRYLEYRGFEVKHVVNLGDIDDRTVHECIRKGCDFKEFTSHWENVFLENTRFLAALPAHSYPRVSDHINDMIDLTKKLLDKGLAYEKLRSVYFSINRFKNYGRLSNYDFDKVARVHSTEYDYYEKNNPRDFALFKRSTLAELKAGLYWSSPWGNVRPSWHIECACIGPRHLGQPFDIHTASTDLVFPHGDNEIAIAEAANDKPLASLWLHSEVVMVNGKKVNRFTENYLTLDDLKKLGYDGRTIRFWLLQTHYRKVLKYSAASLNQARKSLARLHRFCQLLHDCRTGQANPDLDQMIYETRSTFHQAMDNDLNIPQALGHLFGFIRSVNSTLTSGDLAASQKEKIIDFINGLDSVLSVIHDDQKTPDETVERLLKQRHRARLDHDFHKADAIREELHRLNIEVRDKPLDASE